MRSQCVRNYRQTIITPEPGADREGVIVRRGDIARAVAAHKHAGWVAVVWLPRAATRRLRPPYVYLALV